MLAKRAARESAARLRSLGGANVLASRGMATENKKDGKVMHPDLLNRHIKATEYAVRGELYLRGEELRREGKEIIFTNVGNPHALGQPPITFTRQVCALVAAPMLLDHPDVKLMFPEDAIDRARHFLQSKDMIPGGIGAYSDSRGALGIRKEVAQFIADRDGVAPTNPDNIFLTDGASVAVRSCLNALIRGPEDGIMVPIPQYPLYSASIKLYDGQLCPYYLDESTGWGLKPEELKRSIAEARSKGINVRGLVFINPGNPTGQCLTKEDLQGLAQFAKDEGVVLMADEVYQENVYQDERPFVSMRSVVAGMPELKDDVELFSFHTVSKGSHGECGFRGGYVECTNIHPGTVDEIYKIASINLSPNILGQVMMSLMVNPPKDGDLSYPDYIKERRGTIASLRRRAHMMTDAFNSLEGVECVFTEGAMYSFPKITLPPKAMEAAKAAGKPADTFYCLRLLEETGISAVPGTGFGQEPGTFHFRTTILPMEDKIAEVVELFKNFHSNFMAQYK